MTIPPEGDDVDSQVLSSSQETETKEYSMREMQNEIEKLKNDMKVVRRKLESSEMISRWNKEEIKYLCLLRVDSVYEKLLGQINGDESLSEEKKKISRENLEKCRIAAKKRRNMKVGALGVGALLSGGLSVIASWKFAPCLSTGAAAGCGVGIFVIVLMGVGGIHFALMHEDRLRNWLSEQAEEAQAWYNKNSATLFIDQLAMANANVAC